MRYKRCLMGEKKDSAKHKVLAHLQPTSTDSLLFQNQSSKGHGLEIRYQQVENETHSGTRGSCRKLSSAHKKQRLSAKRLSRLEDTRRGQRLYKYSHMCITDASSLNPSIHPPFDNLYTSKRFKSRKRPIIEHYNIVYC